MTERSIQQAQALGWFDDPSSEDVKVLKQAFPPSAARRMSLATLAIGNALRGVEIAPEDEIVFVTQYAASRNLEHFLESFPSASPFHFQASIQAAALEMLLVSWRKPVRSVVPFCDDTHALAQGMLGALLSDAACVHLVYAEDHGTWLADDGLATREAFGVHLALSADDLGGLGRIRRVPSATAPEADALARIVVTVRERQPLTLPTRDGAGVALTWQ